MRTLISFIRDQSGASSIEYAIMASCIAMAVIATVNGLGSTVKGNYTSVSVAMK